MTFISYELIKFSWTAYRSLQPDHDNGSAWHSIVIKYTPGFKHNNTVLFHKYGIDANRGKDKNI